MIRGLSAVALAIACAGSAAALDQRAIRQLQALDPAERLEQRCDVEAMDRIRRDQADFRPDKVIAYTFADPVISGDRMKAPGAVFRSRGEWYRLKFKCEIEAQHLDVKTFEYVIGAVVPRQDWEALYLYD